jgi:hypothetical protein
VLVLIGTRVLADATGGAGDEDQSRADRVQDRGGAERQTTRTADHLARPLGRDELHADRPRGGGATGVQHLEGGDDVERVEAVEQNDLSVHAVVLRWSSA